VSIDRVRARLAEAQDRLQAAGVEDAASDARRLMAFVLGIGRHEVLMSLDREMDKADLLTFQQVINRRAAREPVSRILSERAFWKDRFHISDAVLDPRPETETLVAEAVLRPFRKVLDLGTGSGCILLSCLREQPDAAGLGIDLSEAAIDVARINARSLGLEGRAGFRVSDWFRSVAGVFDLIVSNPPYIADAEMAGLAPEVRDHDPHLALTPGGDGLDAFRAIARGAGAHLAPGGRLLVEIGPAQGAAVAALFAAAGLSDPRVLPDLDGRDRVVAAVKPGADGGECA
jgi:release factor glutamine methyltransferase